MVDIYKIAADQLAEIRTQFAESKIFAEGQINGITLVMKRISDSVAALQEEAAKQAAPVPVTPDVVVDEESSGIQ